jgi:uncharacterized protein YjbI with pentapeptide repeats
MNGNQQSRIGQIYISSLGAFLVLGMLYLPSLYVRPLTQQVSRLEKHLSTLALKTGGKPQQAGAADYALLFKLNKDVLDSKNAFRSMLAQGIGGLLLFGTAYISWRTLRAQNDKQVAERFSKGVEQLGSDNIHVRLGGIFTLEQVANDSGDAYYRQVVECLTSFVRERAPYVPLLAAGRETSEEKLNNGGINEVELILRGVPELRTDIQAAIFVLGRRRYSFGRGEDFRLDLRATDLHHIEFPENANFDGTLFRGSNLNSCTLSKVSLRLSDLSYTRLERVTARSALLDESNLDRAKLNSAELSGASLRNTSLGGAELARAVAVNTQFSGANLSNANLSKTRLSGSNFDNAVMVETNLANADLVGCSILGTEILTDLSTSRGLSGRQLRMAKIDDSVIELGLNDEQKKLLAEES